MDYNTFKIFQKSFIAKVFFVPRIVSQTIDDERYYFGVFSEAHQDSDKLTRVALTRGMKKMFC